MIAAVAAGPLLSVAVAGILSGGFLGGVVALIKVRPEGDQILVAAAKDVVLIQGGVLDEFRNQLKELQTRFDHQVQESAVAIAECHAEREELRRERDTERSSNRDLRSRIEALESEVAALRSQTRRNP